MFPVYAGVIPMIQALKFIVKGVPRVCGGDPSLDDDLSRSARGNSVIYYREESAFFSTQ